jgi:hypothetical protein
MRSFKGKEFTRPNALSWFWAHRRCAAAGLSAATPRNRPLRFLRGFRCNPLRAHGLFADYLKAVGPEKSRSDFGVFVCQSAPLGRFLIRKTVLNYAGIKPAIFRSL